VTADSRSRLLDVQDLTVSFRTTDGSVQAVRNVSFDLDRGKTLAIVGESGSGKSALSLSLMGLLDRRQADVSGKVLIGGRNLLELGSKELRAIRGKDIAMVFQDPFACLHPLFRVGDQIAEAGMIHGQSRRRAEERAVELLDRVGIPDADSRCLDYPHEYSGGMRQRAMIAMALMNNPAILIADEPTTALDVRVQAQIMRLIADVKEEFDIGVIFVSHDLGLVADVADSIMVMYAGRAVEYGACSDVLERPQHPYTWGLLESMPTVDRRLPVLPAIPGSPPSTLMPPPGCAFHPRCRYRFEPCDGEVPKLVSAPGMHADACYLAVDEKLGHWSRRSTATTDSVS